MGSPRVIGDALAQGPHPHLHCSTLLRPFTGRNRDADPATAAQCGSDARDPLPVPPIPGQAGGALLTLLAPSRSCPGCAVSFTHFATLSTTKGNVINPPAATWLSPPSPLLRFFRPLGQYSPQLPAAGHGAPGRLSLGRSLGGAWAEPGRGLGAPALPPSPGKPWPTTKALVPAYDWSAGRQCLRLIGQDEEGLK